MISKDFLKLTFTQWYNWKWSIGCHCTFTRVIVQAWIIQIWETIIIKEWPSLLSKWCILHILLLKFNNISLSIEQILLLIRSKLHALLIFNTISILHELINQLSRSILNLRVNNILHDLQSNIKSIILKLINKIRTFQDNLCDYLTGDTFLDLIFN